MNKEQQKSTIFVRYLKFILKNLHIIWKFSRPHTVIGTFISVFTLFFISNHANSLVLPWNWTTFILTIVSCVACNVYITGLNQIYDVDIDRENKPNLPLVTEELSMVDAKKIVVFALMIALVFSYFQNLFFGGLVTGIAIIGSLYTIPPVRLKRYHFWAATAIALVRGPLINIGIYIHFYASQYGLPIHFNSKIALLTVFITAFSIGIAWFKDIPDVDGDKNNNIKTLSVKHGKKTALRLGTMIVGFAYLLCILYSFWPNLFVLNLSPDPILAKTSNLSFGIYHTIALIYFITISYKLNTNNTIEVKKFYMSYWILFFLEYIAFILF